MIVDVEFYYDTYFGEMVPEDEFGKYEAAAERIVLLATRGVVTAQNISDLPAFIQDAIKNAICAQMEYYGNVGLEAASVGVSGSSFTVGKVSITRNTDGNEKTGAASMTLAPAARMFLEQTGLLNRSVAAPVYPFAPFPPEVF